MSLGSLCYVFYLGSFILPLMRSEFPNNGIMQSTAMYWFIYVFQLVSAIVCGFGASIFWIAEGKYISELCNDKNRGMFNATAWVGLMFSAIVGNAIGAFVIKKFKPSTFYIVLTIFCLIAALYFLLLPKPIP